MLASAILRDVEYAELPFESLTPVGSLRRFAPDVGDVTLLGIAPSDRYTEIAAAVARLPGFLHVTPEGPTTFWAQTERGGVTLLFAEPQHAGAALVWHTGSREHTSQLQARARERGLEFVDGRLSRKGTDIGTEHEEAVYGYLDLPYITPELREGTDEVTAAARGELPSLVTERDIRGDLHMHSTWSDGRDSIDHMAYAAQQLGYEYIAITDHSERSLASRKLAASDISRQRREIDKARRRARSLTILHGIEVDIMHDGSLDFGDADLERFDVVLASLHDHGGHDGARLTERYLRAIHHPLVNIITHPANRAPARSRGYEVDFDRLFAAAAATGTAMEIDGAPGHLDMDGLVARRAVAMGVTVAIDSDCHRADALGRQMRFGLGTARRGWVEPPHVLNARSIDEVRAFVAAKRARR
jgi:DNA polymerase (family 10)